VLVAIGLAAPLRENTTAPTPTAVLAADAHR